MQQGVPSTVPLGRNPLRQILDRKHSLECLFVRLRKSSVGKSAPPCHLHAAATRMHSSSVCRKFGSSKKFAPMIKARQKLTAGDLSQS
jgi:hypothetical protein